MGLDGFSIANVGLPRKLTSAQLANNAESLALKGSEWSIKNVDGLAKKQAAVREEEQLENEGGTYYLSQQDNEEEKEDDSQQNEPQKKFLVKLNPKTNLIELYDLENDIILETITPSDLINLVTNLKSPSGIFVNKKI